MQAVKDAGLSVFHTSTLFPDLKLPAIYRGDFFFASRLEYLPFFRRRGRLLFVGAEKTAGGEKG
jgi:hypothetical protein